MWSVKIRSLSRGERLVMRRMSPYPPHSDEYYVIRGLRTKAVLNHALIVSGLTLAALDKAIDKTLDEGSKIAFKWDRLDAYIGRRSAAHLEELAPGCLAVFDQPIWKLFDPDTVWTESTIYETVLPFLEQDAEWKRKMDERRHRRRIRDGIVYEEFTMEMYDAEYWFDRGGERGFVAIFAVYLLANVRCHMPLLVDLLTMMFRKFPELGRVDAYKPIWLELLNLVANSTVQISLIASQFTVDKNIIKRLIDTDQRVTKNDGNTYDNDPIIYMKHVPERLIEKSSTLWDFD